jgi:hypothetical protein
MHKKQVSRKVCDAHRDQLLGNDEWSEGREIDPELDAREYRERKYELPEGRYHME